MVATDMPITGRRVDTAQAAIEATHGNAARGDLRDVFADEPGALGRLAGILFEWKRVKGEAPMGGATGGESKGGSMGGGVGQRGAAARRPRVAAVVRRRCTQGRSCGSPGMDPLSPRASSWCEILRAEIR